MVEPVEILRYARDVVLSDESKWSPSGPGDWPHTFCALVACDRAANQMKARGGNGAAVQALNAVLASWQPEWCGNVGSFNDDPATSFSDVIDLFDRAIKRCEEA